MDQSRIFHVHGGSKLVFSRSRWVKTGFSRSRVMEDFVTVTMGQTCFCHSHGGSVITRVSPLVSGRSRQGLPDKGPVVGGKYSGFALLGDVSAEGITTVLNLVGAFYAKCLDKIVF
jgi:hypothetical protein